MRLQRFIVCILVEGIGRWLWWIELCYPDRVEHVGTCSEDQDDERVDSCHGSRVAKLVEKDAGQGSKKANEDSNKHPWQG